MSSWQESYGHAGLHGGFTSGRMDGSITIEGIEDTLNRLNSLQTSNPGFERQIHQIVKAVIRKAALKTKKAAKGETGDDPRKAYLAVKSMVYKRIFGGNVNIISRHKRTGYAASLPPEKQQTGRGGNRRKRSARTEQIMSYWGADRGFILRFLNDGTKRRQISTSNNRKVNKFVGRGHTSASLQQFRNGNRGTISARNWFRGASMQAIEDSSRELSTMIEEAIQERWGGSTASLDYDISQHM